MGGPLSICDHARGHILCAHHALCCSLLAGDRLVVAYGGRGGLGLVAPSRQQRLSNMDKQLKHAQVRCMVVGAGLLQQ